MLNTPIGMRQCFDYEAEMLREAVVLLSSHIKKNIASYRDKNVERIAIQPVKGESLFLSLPPMAQLNFLTKVLGDFQDNVPREMDQHTNSAFECLYSCIFYEIKKEIEGNKNARMRQLTAHTWMSFFPNQQAVPALEKNLDKWLHHVDKLAGQTVFQEEIANKLLTKAA